MTDLPPTASSTQRLVSTETAGTSLTSLSPEQSASMAASMSSFLSAASAARSLVASSQVITASSSRTPSSASTFRSDSTTLANTGASVSPTTSSFPAPTITPPLANMKRGLSSTAIAGLSIGILLGCCALVIVVFLMRRKSRQRNRPPQHTVSPGVNLFAGRAELEAKDSASSSSPHEQNDSSERRPLTNVNRHELEA